MATAGNLNKTERIAYIDPGARTIRAPTVSGLAAGSEQRERHHETNMSLNILQS